MRNIKVLSLFSGIGAPEKALTNIGVNYDLVGFSEIESSAISAYSLIHGIDSNLNLGDIADININNLLDFDLLLAGFPCTDISHNGKQMGFSDTNTSSGLVNYAIEVIYAKKPKFILFENVKNLISKRFKPDFDLMISKIESYGYRSYYKLLNTKDFGLPHNRERVFMIFIRDDQDISFDFEFEEKQLTSLYEILKQDDFVDNISESTKNKIESQFINEDIIKNESINGNRFKEDKVICLNSKNKEGKQPSQQYRVYSKTGLMTTLSSQLSGRYNIVSELGHIRKITPREAYLLQGFSEDDFNKVKHLPHNTLFAQAGNTMSVPVLEEIFKKIFKDIRSNEYINNSIENQDENSCSINLNKSIEQISFDLI